MNQTTERKLAAAMDLVQYTRVEAENIRAPDLELGGGTVLVGPVAVAPGPQCPTPSAPLTPALPWPQLVLTSREVIDS